MNRSDKIKLPAFLEAVKLPNHPMREEAKSTWKFSWMRTTATTSRSGKGALQAYLKKQAAEEAEQ